MKLVARCHPLLEPLLPKPVAASRALPQWFKDMPSLAMSKVLGGHDVRTIKHCPPFIDAMNLGLLLPLATDVTITGGKLSWDWDPPIISDAPITRAPVGLHVPEQATGAPIDRFIENGRLLLKFTNFWTLEAPAGWSVLFTHPLNRPDLPFHTLSGLVDCDRFNSGYVHFPALLNPDFEGTIPANTPVAQAIAVPREKTELDVLAMTEIQIAESRHTQEALGTETGIYRKRFRH